MKLRFALPLVALAALVAAAAPAIAAPAPHSPNLIRNAGAERTTKKPDPSGGKVGVVGWAVPKAGEFTAVAYGTPAFPDKTSPGPKARGKNFFAGGPDGAVNRATQTDSLAAYKGWIGAGKARFTLAGWLG